MASKTIHGWVAVTVALAAGLIVARMTIFNGHSGPPAQNTGPAERSVVSKKAPGPEGPAVEPAGATEAPRRAAPFVERAPRIPSMTAGGPTAPDGQPAEPAVAPQAPPPADEAIPAPLARAALGLVGTDSEAEEVWALAINDPDRPPEERQDLIEDLNEDGFPDPSNPTQDDLPLIVSRMELIEELAPDAMDDVNAAAFEEAYKDLTNMYRRLTER